jgi:hypothetical protein
MAVIDPVNVILLLLLIAIVLFYFSIPDEQ